MIVIKNYKADWEKGIISYDVVPEGLPAFHMQHKKVEYGVSSTDDEDLLITLEEYNSKLADFVENFNTLQSDSLLYNTPFFVEEVK